MWRGLETGEIRAFICIYPVIKFAKINVIQFNNKQKIPKPNSYLNSSSGKVRGLIALLG